MRQDVQGQRLAALRRVMRRAGLSAMLVTHRPNVRYFSGFTGEDSYLLVERRRATLLTDGRFAEQAALECPRARRIIRRGRMTGAIAGAVAGRGIRTLGLEGGFVSINLRSALERALKGVRLHPLNEEIAALRQTKDAAEVSAITRAIRVAEGAMASLIAAGAGALIGRTERQVAAELEYRMRLGGGDAAAFETIVAVNAHSSLPHYRAGDARIRRGDFVLIDWGALVGGYRSDLTRVLFTGRIPPQIGRMYEIVLRAQAAGMAAIAAGAGLESADGAARAVIAGAGFGDRFDHGLGHGIGLEVHEAPRLGRQARGRLQAGMVVTVEPGIYLPGVGGVRIEDDVLVTVRGRRRLSRLPRRLEAWALR